MTEDKSSDPWDFARVFCANALYLATLLISFGAARKENPTGLVSYQLKDARDLAKTARDGYLEDHQL